MNALKELPEGVINDGIIDNSASERLNSDMHAMKELPVAVLDQARLYLKRLIPLKVNTSQK
jgi:hypothetical protein